MQSSFTPRNLVAIFHKIEGSVGLSDMIHSGHPPIAWNTPRKRLFAPVHQWENNVGKLGIRERKKNCPSMIDTEDILWKVGGLAIANFLAARQGGRTGSG
jgi:hypothetical protein